MESLFEIVHEDADLLVINKPAGLVCHPTKAGEWSSLVGRVRLHLGPDTRWHLINRLDRETSGITIVAKSDALARDLRRQWESRLVTKEYLAIVHGHVPEEHGVICAPLGRDERSRVAIKDCVRPDGAPAETEFRVERRFETVVATDGSSAFSLLRVFPRTGRKHQIRIHLAHLGHPIVGDKLYGADEDLYLALVEDRLSEAERERLILPYHALHARAVECEIQGNRVRWECEPEKWFNAFNEAVAQVSCPTGDGSRGRLPH